MDEMAITRQRPNFAAAPHELVDDETISPQAKTIYLILDRHADYKSGTTFVGKERVAKKCGYSKPDSIDRYLNELREKGWLSWRRRWRRSTGKMDSSGRPVYEYSFSAGEGFEPTTNLYTVNDRVTGPRTGDIPVPATGGQGYPSAEGQPVPATRGTNENQVNENQVNENQRGASAPAADAPPPTPRKKLAHELPENWRPDPHVWEQMAEQRPDVDLELEHAKFCDYWPSQPGSRSRKKDWNATWRNWIRNARAAQSGGGQSKNTLEAWGYTPESSTLPWEDPAPTFDDAPFIDAEVY